MLRVAALAIYPVKGLRAIDLQSMQIVRPGPQDDRRWAVAGPDSRVLTQRQHPAMATIAAHPLSPGTLRLRQGPDHIDTAANGPATTIDIWGTTIPCTEADPAASAWLSARLGTPATLVHLTDPTARTVTPDLAHPGDVVSFADGFPLLVTTTASLAALNAHLPTPVPMDRFRPNLVIETTTPWDEDTWSHLTIGPVRLRLASPCTRCKVITLDQHTGAATPRLEPLRTLGTLHRDSEGHINFGWNAIPETLGDIPLSAPAIAHRRT